MQIGLTGGIASGKSTASARFHRLGAVVIDADVLAREATAPGSPGLAAVTASFGPEFVLPDGSLDRARLGRAVFTDARARTQLERIIHPRVALRRAELAQAALEDDPGAVVVHDVPLLVEKRLTGGLDLVVVVDAPEELRMRRLIEQRGQTESDARARLAVQASRSERLAVADVVLDGSGPPSHLEQQVESLWQRLSVGDLRILP